MTLRVYSIGANIMSIVVREFNSIGEFIKSIDDDLSEMRRKLGELLRKLEELRVKLEQERKIKKILSKLGAQAPEASTSNTIELKTIKLIMNPTAEQEVTALEQAVETLNNKITQFQAVKKDLEVLGGMDIEIKLTAIYMDGLPKTILIRII